MRSADDLRGGPARAAGSPPTAGSPHAAGSRAAPGSLPVVDPLAAPASMPTAVQRTATASTEARRLVTICNACRYCEGFCAVFPALERRTVFTDGDLAYLANLCHDCRGCFYACQYAPPHEFGVNLPRTLAELRRETYERSAWPPPLGRLFRRNGLAVGLITAAATALVIGLALALQDPAVLFGTHRGEGAFYEVVPYAVMVLPASGVALFAMLALVLGGWRYALGSGGLSGAGPADLVRGTLDAVRLTYLGGGGDGCNYPAERFSERRRWLHHLVVWGFALNLAATTVAAMYENLLGVRAPYPLTSLPVVLGTLGGVLLVVGPAGLLALRRRADPEPADSGSVGMDVAFLWLLLLTSVTGLALLALRETPAMGTLLVVHLGVVAGLFVTVPYGKLAHAVYRWLALVRHAAESRAEAAVQGGA